MNKIKALKIAALISGILAVTLFIYPFVVKFIVMYIFNTDIDDTASSIGIIGSSDGPTAIFIANASNIFYPVLKYIFAVICVISVMCMILLKKRN